MKFRRNCRWRTRCGDPLSGPPTCPRPSEKPGQVSCVLSLHPHVGPAEQGLSAHAPPQLSMVPCCLQDRVHVPQLGGKDTTIQPCLVSAVPPASLDTLYPSSPSLAAPLPPGLTSLTPPGWASTLLLTAWTSQLGPAVTCSASVSMAPRAWH